MKRPHAHSGFTLTELAIVLLIVGLLVGGLLMPLSAQRDTRNFSDTQKSLNDIREALIGFAIINGRLPCPDTDTDPTSAGYGIEEATCTADAVTEGFLPWRTLGVPEHDAWGAPWQTGAQPRQGHWRYRVERKYADTAQLKTLILDSSPSNSNACTASAPPAFPDDCLGVRNIAGQALYENKERPIAIVYSVGRNNAADRDNASYEAGRLRSPMYTADTATADYDDMLIWLSRSTLASRLLAAGKLP